MLRECLAFIKKDLLIAWSYKAHFFMGWFWVLNSLFISFFIAKLIDNGAIPYLSDYGGDYFSFLLVGILFSSYINAALIGFGDSISTEQTNGTLEFLFASPVKMPVMILSMNLWRFISATINVIIYLIFGTLLLGVKFDNANILAGIIILCFTIVTFSSIGIISASFIIICKRGNPINTLLGGLSSFFGGVFFPVSILPKGLQLISYCIPLTYSLRALRHALLAGYSFELLANDIAILALFCLVLVPLSIFCFKTALTIAKRNATLSHY